VTEARVRFALLCAARDAAISARVGDGRARLARTAAALDALSPLAVLKRGYALAQDAEGHFLRDARQVAVGDSVHLRLAQGALVCRVEEQENK
jgi:exodeoxyribonuclease VII large subunit